MRRLATVGLVAVLVVVLGGCGFFTKTGLETGDHSKVLQPQSVERADRGDGVETLDDLFAKVAQQVPAFGGLFFDDKGQLTMYLVEGELGAQAAAVAALRMVFPNDESLAGPILVLPGKYGFLQLKKWYDSMWGALVEAIPGNVTLTDIDDTRNRLLVGVINLELQSQVEQELAKLGIPREAVIIEQAGPGKLDTTLRDRVRPLVGGIQIFP